MCIAHWLLENRKKSKVTRPTIAQTNNTIIARDTWMPSLENWGGGLKIFVCIYMYMHTRNHYMYQYIQLYKFTHTLTDGTSPPPAVSSS